MTIFEAFLLILTVALATAVYDWRQPHLLRTDDEPDGRLVR